MHNSHKNITRKKRTNPEIAGRVEHFLYRVPEELYDFQADPDALDNLVYVPANQVLLDGLRRDLAQWMEDTNDPLLDTFRAHAGLTEPEFEMPSLQVPWYERSSRSVHWGHRL